MSVNGVNLNIAAFFFFFFFFIVVANLFSVSLMCMRMLDGGLRQFRQIDARSRTPPLPSSSTWYPKVVGGMKPILGFHVITNDKIFDRQR